MRGHLSLSEGDDTCHMLSKEKTKGIYIHECDFYIYFKFFPIDLSNKVEAVRWKGRGNSSIYYQKDSFQVLTDYI